MAHATDIEKFYTLIGAIPGSYKDIAGDEYSLKVANKNWPLLRTMAASAIDIPAVMVGEKFEMKVNVNLVERTAREPTPVNEKKTSVPTDLRFSENVAVVPAVEVLLINDVSKSKVNSIVKVFPVVRPHISEPKLVSLFRRLEGGRDSNIIKWRW